MAYSDVDVVNYGLTLLGDLRITSLSDDTKQAREAKAIFNMTRDRLLGRYDWSFAKTRTKLSPLSTSPAFQFTNQFQLPVDCIRITMVAEQYVGLSLEDYRNQPSEDFIIEGRILMTDLEVPLRLRYVKQVTDSSLYPPTFACAFAAQLADLLCEPLTQSGEKRDRAKGEYKQQINDAIRANAIELPPRPLPDDSWVDSRL